MIVRIVICNTSFWIQAILKYKVNRVLKIMYRLFSFKNHLWQYKKEYICPDLLLPIGFSINAFFQKT